VPIHSQLLGQSDLDEAHAQRIRQFNVQTYWELQPCCKGKSGSAVMICYLIQSMVYANHCEADSCRVGQEISCLLNHSFSISFDQEPFVPEPNLRNL
jgi:hypothetical protein